MAYLAAILVSLALFFGFVGVTALERRRGVRFFGSMRERLDTRTVAVIQAARTFDPLDALIRGTRSLFGHVFHDLANVAWAIVRMLERALANIVRTLRTMRHHEAKETSSGYVKSISEHKHALRAETPSEGSADNTVG